MLSLKATSEVNLVQKINGFFAVYPRKIFDLKWLNCCCWCCGQWPNYMDKYVRTGTSAL